MVEAVCKGAKGQAFSRLCRDSFRETENCLYRVPARHDRRTVGVFPSPRGRPRQGQHWRPSVRHNHRRSREDRGSPRVGRHHSRYGLHLCKRRHSGFPRQDTRHILRYLRRRSRRVSRVSPILPPWSLEARAKVHLIMMSVRVAGNEKEKTSKQTIG